ncbi:hypothetical protein LAZ67_16001569 [Cordylochernes scorpioides]|uniref:Uncharacterized protein n=1 Tax=Cordylochernes scorpioides TaxID=51811 RepID=A0ABY6LCL2_9ARAC|nr:hypothetical protein LAZ67_16001569 [Cordylochernes scorpioides]
MTKFKFTLLFVEKGRAERGLAINRAESESEEENPAQVPSAYFSLQQPRCPSTFSGDGSEDAQLWLKDYKRIAQYNMG